MPTLSQFRESLKRDRPHVERSLIAGVALVVAAVLGTMANRRLQPLEKQMSSLRAAARTISSFQRSFQVPTEAERQLWASSDDSLALSVPAGSRLPLAQTVARNAEGAGLVGVRVRFAPADSLYVPPRTSNADAAISPSKITVIVECEGGFASLLTFVNTLPPAVSVIRLSGMRGKTTTVYHITLAVYETMNATQPG
jgi:hypothetical protein